MLPITSSSLLFVLSLLAQTSAAHRNLPRHAHEHHQLEGRLQPITATTTVVVQMTQTSTVWVKPTDQAAFGGGGASGAVGASGGPSAGVSQSALNSGAAGSSPASASSAISATSLAGTSRASASSAVSSSSSQSHVSATMPLASSTLLAAQSAGPSSSTRAGTSSSASGSGSGSGSSAASGAYGQSASMHSSSTILVAENASSTSSSTRTSSLAAKSSGSSASSSSSSSASSSLPKSSTSAESLTAAAVSSHSTSTSATSKALSASASSSSSLRTSSTTLSSARQTVSSTSTSSITHPASASTSLSSTSKAVNMTSSSVSSSKPSNSSAASSASVTSSSSAKTSSSSSASRSSSSASVTSTVSASKNATSTSVSSTHSSSSSSSRSATSTSVSSAKSATSSASASKNTTSTVMSTTRSSTTASITSSAAHNTTSSTSKSASITATSTHTSSLNATSTKTSSSASSTSTLKTLGSTLMNAYYPDWSGDYLTPEDVDFSRYDVVDFAFALPTSDFGLEFTQDDSADLLTRLVTVAHAAGKRVKLSIGGWTGSTYFSTICASSSNRKTFITNIMAAYDLYNIDGIDIDWEYPGTTGADGNAVSSSDSANFLTFLTELRAALPTGALISTAVQVWPFAGSDGTPMSDVSGFAEVIDWILIMNYDVWGSSTTPGANAPLSDGCGNSSQPLANAYAAVSSWTTAGMPANQITLGVPAYGYLQKSTATQLKDRRSYPALPHKRAAAKSRSSDVTVYNDDGGSSDGQVMFESLISQGALTLSGSSYIGAGGFTREWDSCSSTPWLKSTASGQIITYDDPQSMSLKGQFAAQAGLRGCNVFSIDGDWTGSAWPLTDAVRSGLGL